jgi:hypothetical protein
MPKQRPPFDYECYASLKAQGLSQRQIAREMGMPDATLRNNLKVYQGNTIGVPTTSTKVDQDTPIPPAAGRSTQVDIGTPQDALMCHRCPQVHLGTPRQGPPRYPKVYLGTSRTGTPRCP